MGAENRWRAALAAVIVAQLGNVALPNPVDAAAGQLASTTAITLKAADLAVHPSTGKIYASVPNSAPASANSVVTIDGASRTQIGTEAMIGDPNSLELSADGTTLYVGLNGRQSVKKFTVPGFTAGWEKSFVNDGYNSTAVAGDMEIKPDNNDYVVVSVEYPSLSPRHAGLVSLKAGDDLADRTEGHTGSNVIEFGTSPTRLYGLTNEVSSFGFQRISASPTGVTELDETPNLSGYYYGQDIAFADGLVYTSKGYVIDAEAKLPYGTLALETTLNAQGFAVNAATDRAYYIVGTRLLVFSTVTLAKVDEWNLPASASDARSLHLFGADGFVYNTPTQIVIGNLTPSTTQPPATGNAAGEFTPLAPQRVLDSRTGVGMPGNRRAVIGAGGVINLQITGRGGVPATGVDSVVLNVTVTGPSAGGYVTVYPSGIALPDISNLNFTAGQTIANLVTVKLGAGGAVSISNAIGSTDIIADVAGFYASSSGSRGSRFAPVTPHRIVDTRTGVGAPRAKVGPKQSLRVDVAGVGGVPAVGVTAVALNVTAEGPTAGSYLTVYPANLTMPDASNLNFGANEVVPNQVIVKVSPDGFVNVANDAGATNVLIDIVGYYHENRVGDTGRFVSLTPFRWIDTRRESPFPGGKLRSGNTLYGGEDTAAEEPFLAWAINVTVTGTEGGGFVTVYPYPGTPPDASNLNYVNGRDVPNHAIAPTGHQVGFYNYGGRVHLLVDIFGAFLK